MKLKMALAMLLTTLLILTACQGPAEETASTEAPVAEEKTMDDASEPMEEVSADVENDPVADTEEKKRIEGPFKDMIAPDFTLADVNGNEVALGDLRGNAVALIFWASW